MPLPTCHRMTRRYGLFTLLNGLHLRLFKVLPSRYFYGHRDRLIGVGDWMKIGTESDPERF